MNDRARAALSKANPGRDGKPRQASVGGLRRTSSLSRSSTIKPSRGSRQRPGGPDAGQAWRAAVLDLWFPGRRDDECEVPCPVSGVDLRAGWHCHHIIEAKTLWGHGLADRIVEVVDERTGELVAAPAVWHPFVGMPVSQAVNLGFESGTVQIPRQLIPARTWRLAAVLDDLDPLAGPRWATERLNRDYPEVE